MAEESKSPATYPCDPSLTEETKDPVREPEAEVPYTNPAENKGKQQRRKER